jgi:DegV family protein with EDD domain
MATLIVTDSSADLPPALAHSLNITVIPCYILLDDVNYKDTVEISADDFYARLVTGRRMPSTSQPSVADFQAVYQGLLAQGHDIVSIHVSGRLSGTINSAEQARASLSESARIEIIDSRLASMSLGLVTIAAAQLAQAGEPSSEIARQVKRHLPNTHGFFVLDTLEYLQKGGRIGKAQAFLGSLLNVKPILKLQDGEAHPVERIRNRNRAIARMVDILRALAPVQQLAIMYSTEPDRAAELRQQLSDIIFEKNIVTSQFGPTLGTYLGPNAIGVAIICVE